MSNVLAFAPKGVDLDIADDREYVDYMLKRAFREGAVWELCLHEARIDRTVELLKNTKSSMEQQLGAAKREQKGGNPTWRKNTLNLLRLVNTFLSEAKAEQKRLDDEEREDSAEAELEEWQRVCGQIVDLFLDNPALELVELPGYPMTAGEWARRRSAKADRKLQAVAA